MVIPFQPTRNRNLAQFQGQVNFKDFIFASKKPKTQNPYLIKALYHAKHLCITVLTFRLTV